MTRKRPRSRDTESVDASTSVERIASASVTTEIRETSVSEAGRTAATAQKEKRTVTLSGKLVLFNVKGLMDIQEQYECVSSSC